MTELVQTIVGGLLIGIAAVTLLLFSGRVAGISGIVAREFYGPRERWQLAFLIGFLVGGVLLLVSVPSVFAVAKDRSLLLIGLGGLIVGFGTAKGNGCTSGHGVCGIGRFSSRSIAATGVFMFTGMLTASLLYLFGSTVGAA